MSKTSKPFVKAKKLHSESIPECVDLTYCEATFHQGRDRDIRIRPLLGGIKISSPRNDATLGIAYISDTGGKRILISGHTAFPGAFIGQPDSANRVATVMEMAPQFNGLEVDVAKANVEFGVEINDNGIFGNLIDYWIDVYSYWASEGQDIQIEGANSGTSNGKVKFPYAQINIGG